MKRVLVKTVNVYPPRSTVITSSRRITSPLKEVTMPMREIVQCLQGRAVVEEILMDGSTIRLTKSNYDKDNNYNLRIKMAEEAKPVKKVEEAPTVKAAPEKVVDVVKEVLENTPDTSEEVFNPLDIEPVEEPVVDVNTIELSDDMTEEELEALIAAEEAANSK